MISKLASNTLREAVDPVIAFFARDYAEIGGWSLFIGLALFIVVGAVKEWWVPGGRYRRLEESALKSAEAMAITLHQNGQLITSNEITKHFFEETTPKRKEQSE